MGKKKVDIKYESLSRSIKSILNKRDVIDQETLERFLDPSFEHLRKKDVLLKEVLKRIKKGIKENKKFLIWGDQDLDGITASLIMKMAMQNMTNKNVEIYIPDREKEGYGLSKEGINIAVSKGVEDIITVDCGITSFNEVEYLLEKGLDIIITDHHEPRDILPKALILNPKLSNFGYTYLSGAGVAFKLADSLFDSISGKLTSDWIIEYPEIPIWGMIGTISDRVPQLDENRVLIIEGQKFLEDIKNPPFTVLQSVGSIESAIEPLHSGTDNLTLKFFTSKSLKEAKDIYSELEAKHSYWSLKAGEQFLSFRKQLNSGYLVLFDPDLDCRFAGTIANRARDYTEHPVFIIYTVGDKLRGEGRAPKDFDLLSILDEVSDLLVDYGGHKVACGFNLKEGKVEEFINRVNPELEKYESKIIIDSKIRLKDITPELQHFIKKMEPFGKGNSPPIVKVEDLNYKISNGVPIIFDRENVLTLDIVKEMPPPSKRVNVYLRIDGNKISLLKWEWVEGKNKD
jgi:single-stranded-DNA-specific exonuclease